MLKLTHIQTGYNGKSILTIPKLEIASGARCLLKGASGSGKTTLLYALAGLGELQGGSIHHNQTDLYALNEAARDHYRGAHFGIVFQTLHLMKSLTVRQNIELGASINHQFVDSKYVEYLLQRLGIEALADKSATAISQGQAQRVAIARALVLRPDVLLADEPTSSLDDVAAQQVMSLLGVLAGENKTTLVVASHDARITPFFDQIFEIGR